MAKPKKNPRRVSAAKRAAARANGKLGGRPPTPSADQRCSYCGHTRGQHDKPEPGNPPPSLRCGAQCVCAAFIERDGRPDWVALAQRSV